MGVDNATAHIMSLREVVTTLPGVRFSTTRLLRCARQVMLCASGLDGR
jgi:hypothetical protein